MKGQLGNCRALLRKVVVVLFFGHLAGNLVAQPIKLRVADSLPLGNYIAEHGAKYWMNEVTKRTKGAVEFEYYPTEQLGKAKDMLDLTLSGAVDIGYVVPGYVSDKMPLSAITELPGLFSSSCEGTLAYWKLAKGGGVLAKREFEPNKVIPLIALVPPSFQLFMATRKIESLKSIEGAKLRTAGAGGDEVARVIFKAVPIRIAPPEIYEALSRGTIDGLQFPYASLLSYKLTDLVKYATEGEKFGSGVVTYMISEARWNRLTPEIRQAMAEASEATVRNLCAKTDANLRSEIEQTRKLGVPIVQLPASDRQVMESGYAKVGDAWAEALTKRGKPGKEVLQDFKSAIGSR